MMTKDETIDHWHKKCIKLQQQRDDLLTALKKLAELTGDACPEFVKEAIKAARKQQ